MTEKKGTLFIISAPSGAGKTSLVKALLHKTDNIKISVSYTTRKARKNEQKEGAYHFVGEEKFKNLIEQNKFLEYAKVFGSYYGTSREWVENELNKGNNIILEIDWQGARQVNLQIKDSVKIFILPPSYTSLHERLKNRKTDSKDVVDFRMQNARQEISHYSEYDFIIINDVFEKALTELKSIIVSSGLEKNRHIIFYERFVDQIMAK